MSNEIVIKQIDRDNIGDADRCDGIFTVASKLELAADNETILYRIVPVPPYEKRYPAESVDYMAYLNSPQQTVYLAYIDGVIAGEIRLRQNWNRYVLIENIVVDVNYRRRGVGKALMKKAIEWARERQLPGLMLETQNNNVAGCMLYQQCGFELAGFDRRLYQGIMLGTDEIALYWYLIF